MINSEIENDSPENEAFYRFGDFCLDSKRNVLTASGEPVALTLTSCGSNSPFSVSGSFSFNTPESITGVTNYKPKKKAN